MALAREGHVYVIALTLPSGAKRIVGSPDGKLTLTFTDSMEALKVTKHILAQLSPEDREKFMSLKPDLMEVKVRPT